MSESLTQQNEWVKSVLSFDVEAVLAGLDETRTGRMSGEEAPGDEAPELEAEDGKKGKEGAFAFVKRKVGEITGQVPPQPKDQDLADALEALDDRIEAVGKLGFDTKRLLADRTDCAWAGAKAEKLKGDARDEALTRVRKRLAGALKHADALAKSAKSVLGDSEDAPTAEQKSAIYKKALEDHYGLSISNPDNMASTHFDRVFDMFGTVPVDDAIQDKLKKLIYVDGKDWAGSGAYNRVELYVKMGNFGDASRTEEYQIDGKVLPANSFDVTTLHEIGHAVDNKHGVMNAHRAKTGCGGWAPETLDTVTAKYLEHLKATAKLSDDADDGDLSAAIKAALKAGATTKPDTIEQADWKQVVDFLTTKCLPIRSSNSPWFKGSQVVVGGRVYQEAYGNQWWSYDHGARTATKVNSYQWRAPGEWFAEIYAITWLTKKKPPAATDAAAAAYMWNG